MTETDATTRTHPPIPLTARACSWIIPDHGGCPFVATYLLTELEESSEERPDGSEAEFPVCRVHLEPMVDHLLIGQPRPARELPLRLEVLA